jgi:hypothetical protein
VVKNKLSVKKSENLTDIERGPQNFKTEAEIF